MLGRKHIYLLHAQTAIYDSKVKLFLKQGMSHQLGRDAVVWFECENSAIDVIINFLWKIFHMPIVLVVLTIANFRGFSNFCRYYTRSQTGKSTGYRPTLKPLEWKDSNTHGSEESWELKKDVYSRKGEKGSTMYMQKNGKSSEDR